MEKIAIITAASAGIGKACAELFKANNYKLILFSRSQKVKELAQELGVESIQGDLNNREDIEKLIDTAINKYGKIDVVVNNSGHSAKGELLSISDQDWEEGFNLLFMSSVRIARKITPTFEQQESGCIINISSFAAKEPSLQFPISSAIRSSLSSFCKMYASRYGQKNIRMNNVLPGFVDSYNVTDEWLEKIPMNRPAKTNEIAETVLFLASEGATYINGQDIIVDGGLSQSI